MKALPWCIAAAALLALSIMRASDWRFDEYSYVAGAQALGDWLAGRLVWGKVLDQVIGTGWFMPGASVIGAPLFALIEAPPQWLVRAWAGAVNLTLYAALVRSFAATLGPVHRVMILLFPALAAAWHFSLVTLMPDIPAGLIAALALLCAFRIAHEGMGGAVSWRSIAAVELLLAAAIYLRGPMLLLAVALHGLLLVLALSGTRKARKVGAQVAGLAGLALLVAPWSLALSRHFGEPVVTTTNVPLVLAESFGDPARTCFGPCPPGGDIWPEWTFAREQARYSGENPLAVERRMMASSLAGLTAVSYLDRVRQHFGTFLLHPNALVPSYMKVSYAVPAELRPLLAEVVNWLTSIVYLPFLFALLAANIIPLRRSDDLLLQGLLIRLGTGVLFLQPFIHHTSARYWQSFAPLAAWSAALLFTACMRPAIPAERTLPRWLDAAQLAYSGMFIAVATVLGLAGILA